MKAIFILLLWPWVDPGSAALDDWSFIRDKKTSCFGNYETVGNIYKILKVKFEYVTEYVTIVRYIMGTIRRGRLIDCFCGLFEPGFGSSDHRNAVEAPPLADKQVELRCEPYLIDIF